MRTVLAVLVVGLVCLMFSGCAANFVAPVVPPIGLIYTEYKAPLAVEYNNTVVTGKKGSAMTQNVLGCVAWGDASIKTAAAAGSITQVQHVDYEFFNVLGVFSKFTTVVYGN